MPSTYLVAFHMERHPLEFEPGPATGYGHLLVVVAAFEP